LTSRSKERKAVTIWQSRKRSPDTFFIAFKHKNTQNAWYYLGEKEDPKSKNRRVGTEVFIDTLGHN
jgi:hypothetical protein